MKNYHKKAAAFLLAAAMLFPSMTHASDFTDGTEETMDFSADFDSGISSSPAADLGVAPVPEISPTPELTPAPEISPTLTPAPELSPTPEVTPAPKPVVTAKWITKNGKKYWRKSDGTIFVRKGPVTINGARYYLNADGSRVESRWKKIKNNYYFFRQNGTMYRKKGWFKFNNYTYYINSDGSMYTGFLKLKGKTYYLNANGKLLMNKQMVQIKDKYYAMDAKGVVTNISEKQALCSIEAKKFIAKHTNSSMTQNQKFRACFNQLLWYMNYRSKPFNAKDFEPADWPYNYALSVFATNTGNCYGFACTVAACAKELGYKPYVVVTTGDHGFVTIDGLYYDNMGGKFGSSSHSPYNIYKRVLF